MEVKIDKLDHQGRGIAYDEEGILFVENALEGEKVSIKVVKETNKYREAKVDNYITKSEKRVKSKCPFYEECGGCHLRHISYDDTLEFKKNKLLGILKKYASVDIDVNIIKNKVKDFYRNKVEVQIKNGLFGFYQKDTHEIVEVDRCLNAQESINTVLRSTSLFEIQNGLMTIRTNYNGEIIISIQSEEEVEIDLEKLRERCKLVGIILNDKILFGADHFIEIVEDMFFKVTYNSFFQVNHYINKELFKIIRENINVNDVVLDLFSGVGTLSIVASKKALKVYAIEIVENAVRDALVNAKMNKINNINFMLGDAYKLVNKVEDKIDTIIIDPPRKGLSSEAIETILNKEPKKIIYVSCDPITLSRDLKSLKEKYDIQKVYLLDMFSFTFHVESVCVLNRR